MVGDAEKKNKTAFGLVGGQRKPNGPEQKRQKQQPTQQSQDQANQKQINYLKKVSAGRIHPITIGFFF